MDPVGNLSTPIFFRQKPPELDDAAELEPYTSAAARLLGWMG